jgi:hypothetical protein
MQDRAADWRNVMDFGARLDGTTNDSAAFQAAMTATVDDGTIVVPRGGYNVPTAPTRASGNVLWKLDGNRFGTGATPVQYVGSPGDVTETFVQGRKAFYKRATTNTPFAVVDIALDFNNPAGASAVSSGLHVIATPAVNSGSTFVWGINSELNSASNGANQHLAGAFTTRKTGNSPCFALFAQAFDNTGLPSSTGGNLVTCEMDCFANGLDDAVNGGRIVFNAVYGRANKSGADMTVHKAVAIGPQPGELTHATADIMCLLYGTFNQSGFDTRTATQGTGANAIWLGDEHTIALNTSGANTLGYTTTGTPRLRYVVGGTEVWSISDAGVGTGAFLPLTGGTVTGATTFSSTLNVTSTATFAGNALFGSGLTGTTLVRTHAAATGSATMQFYKATTGAAGHRWDITAGTDASGGQLSALAYDDAGVQRAGALFQASRYSGQDNGGSPWWAIAPYTIGFARAVAPNGNIGANIGGANGLTDTQPTSTLGANPFSTTSGFPNVQITWTGAGSATGVVGTPSTTRETWVNITGATPVGGLTISGWYLAAPVNNNTITINVGTNATSTATGGGSAVQITPSFGTNTVSTFSTATTSATTFPIQDIKLFVANPAFYQTSSGKGPNYQQRYSQFYTPPDTSGTHPWIAIGWEQDLINRGGDFGYSPIASAATNLTVGYWMTAVDLVSPYAAGGGTGQNWNMGLVFCKGVVGFYDAISIQPRTLVGAAVDPTGHGGVGLDFFGSYVPLLANPFTTSSGSAVVVVRTVGGAVIGQVNGDIFTMPATVVVNGVTLAAGDYTMASVDTAAGSFNITGVGAASASGAGGGTGLYGFYPKQAPYAPAQWWGEWKHGIITNQAKFDSGGIIETQPGNGILWNDGTGTASVNATARSAGNIDIVLDPAGTGTVRIIGLPTASAGLPSGSLWVNAGVLNVTP